MSLIDRYVPSADFRETHTIAVRAPAEAVLAAALDYRPEGDPFFRRMIALRELPGRMGRSVAAKPPFGIDDFTLLERGAHEIVYGLAGRFWRSDFGLLPVQDARHFMALDEPGIAKLALNFATRPTGRDICELSTQTRVSCAGTRARLAFAPYWYLIRPVSGMIRRRILTSIRRAGEAGHGFVPR